MNKEKSTVLYVDDEEHNLVSFKATFRFDYRVLTALSGHEALQILRENSVDVIISDQRMPEMTGVEFLVHSRDIAPEAIRIILTGYSDIESVVSSINKAQVYRYIGKPWEENDLKMTMDSGIDNLRLVRENRALLEHLAQYNKTLEAQVAQRTEQLQKKTDELERLNHEVLNMNTGLIKLNKEKSHFLALAADEIKKPIDSINHTAVQLVKNISTTSPAKAQDSLVSISQTARRIREIIANLIELNQSEISVNVNPVRFDIGMILQTIDLTYRQQAKAKNIQIEFKRASNLNMVRTDPQHIETILTQLVSNAVKFSPEHSTITTTCMQNGDLLLCEIIDEGPGIPDSEKDLVFQAYSKLSAKPTGGESSVGLGLALVANLVRALRGKVWFENQTKGTKFIIELPQLH
ncbi:MAG: hybrid sensor histidine kinase/response regulator [Ignavibacteria bacterium]|nr:hybrid sensor histidine kinase/response regulator [Ignavibacteria bacterium]